MKELFEYSLVLLIAIVIGVWVYRYFRFGSFLGMSVGARVARTLGSVETEHTLGSKRTLTVHLLERELGQPQYIAVGETTSSRGSLEVTAMKLTPEQARRLAKLLEQAANG
jgi:hypothetical protein